MECISDLQPALAILLGLGTGLALVLAFVGGVYLIVGRR